MKDIIVLYHKNCHDGFGGAYAAWKKLGDSADYIPARSNTPVPEGLEGKVVYCVDFCYPKEVVLELKEKASKVIVIDHHGMNREAAEAADETLFDTAHSGAVLAWKYFHGDTPVPLMLSYIEDGDLYAHKLPHSKELLSVLYMTELEFDLFEKLAHELEDDRTRQMLIEKGTHYSEYYQYLVDHFVERAGLVVFEGYTVYAANIPSHFRSDVGHALAVKQGPFSIGWKDELDKVKVFLRGTGEVDLGALAAKYGGGGHHDAASFIVDTNTNLPFTPYEDTSN